MLDAGKIVAEALKGIGNGGGHASMAGGFVPCTGSDMDVKLLEAQMKERFLNVIADVKKRALWKAWSPLDILTFRVYTKD